MILSPNKTNALAVCLGSYMIALILCVLLYQVLDTGNPVVTAAMLDLTGTILIFLVSRSFNNSSFYDPYWSIAPVPIIAFWICNTVTANQLFARHIFILFLVSLWGIRLTWNWARRWNGFRDEDWRYRDFRLKFKKTYWLVSFLGIHLFPSIIVFLACLPVYPAIAFKSTLDVFDYLATGVTLTAILIETISDEQLQSFLTSQRRDTFLATGLWKYSRHPNYFGEVLFWIGLFLFSIGTDEFVWWAIPGPLGMILLFQFISVPMIDKRMVAGKEGYEEYVRQTSGWIPWFPKRRHSKF